MKRDDVLRNGPWVALIVVGVMLESWALEHDQDATLTRFIRRCLRCRSVPGRIVTWFLLGWLARHLTESDKTD